jgi:hypothetical protein
VKIFDSATFKIKSEFTFPKNYAHGVNIASGDVDDDGLDEIIIGRARGDEPKVSVYSHTGRLQSEFFAYNVNFKGGVSVASCDLDNNGRDEIIAGAGQGGGPHVRVFDDLGNAIVNKGFFAFDEKFSGGVNVACGDINNNRLNEIVVSTDFSEISQVKIFSRMGTQLGNPFDVKEINGYLGTNLALSDFFGDGTAEIIIASDYGDGPNVVILDNYGTHVSTFQAYSQYFQGGVSLSSYKNEKSRYVLTGAGIGGGPHAKLFDIHGNLIREKFAFDSNFLGGISVTSGNIDNDKETELIVVQKRSLQEETDQLSNKKVSVDLSSQTLTIFDHGYNVHDFLFSSGKKGFETPQGAFTVWRKRQKVRMTWYYGAGNSNNYDLPGVPWVLSFSGPYTIHGTYWHNNFGTPMSHGCVNMSIPDAKWMYNWTPIGTKVVIDE